MVREFGSIERRIQVAASPEIVFDVISRPDRMREWWADDAEFELVAGGSGALRFEPGEPGGSPVVEGITVLEVDRPRRFVFRWGHEAGTVADAGNSFLVVFELAPAGGGTEVTMTESGFRRPGWNATALEARYRDHVAGWDHFIPRLAARASRSERPA